MPDRTDEALERVDPRADRRSPMPPGRRIELAVSAAVLLVLVLAVLLAVSAGG